MRKIVLLLVLSALLFCSCQSPSDVSSILEVSSVEETSSEAVSSVEAVSSGNSSQNVSSGMSSEQNSSVFEDSGDISSVQIPEDEPYVELTALTEDEIANLSLPEEYRSAEYKDGFFTKELVAVSFTDGEQKGLKYLHLLISRDGGVSWVKQVFNDTYCYRNFITFSSEKNGCLAVDLDYALGGQSISSIYVTHDGGATWQEATSINTVCRWRISDALFISRNVGFVCTVSHSVSVPVFCRTVDGGMSWEEVVLDTEELKDRKASYGHICKAEYIDGVVEFTVEFRDNNAKTEAEQTFYSKYVSTDMGQTFEKAK